MNELHLFSMLSTIVAGLVIAIGTMLPAIAMGRAISSAQWNSIRTTRSTATRPAPMRRRPRLRPTEARCMAGPWAGRRSGAGIEQGAGQLVAGLEDCKIGHEGVPGLQPLHRVAHEVRAGHR